MKESQKKSEELDELRPQTLLDFFRNSPLVDEHLDLERELDLGRDIEFD